MVKRQIKEKVTNVLSKIVGKKKVSKVRIDPPILYRDLGLNKKTMTIGESEIETRYKSK